MRKLFLLIVFLSLLLPSRSWGAIAFTELAASGGDGGCATGGTTASFTPAANALVLIVVGTEVGTGTAGTVTSITGNSLTYEAVGNALATNSLYRVSVMRAMGSSPTTGTAVIAVSADQANCTWSIVQVTGVATGANGATAIVQSATNSTGAAQTALTVTLSAFASAANATWGGFGTSASSAMTPGSGFTEIGTQTACCGSRTMSEYNLANDTTVNITAASSLLAGVAIELKPAISKKRMPPRHYSWLQETMTALLNPRIMLAVY